MDESKTENENKASTLIQFGQGGRDWSVDVLRIVSCWMVIFVHALNMLANARYGAPHIDPLSADWIAAVFSKSCFVSATTLFVMVSGIFFLSPNRNVTIHKLWTKNIPKMACAYVFWCLAYSVFEIIFTKGVGGLNPSAVIEGAFVQPYHLWYIPMLLVLYVITPFVREITAHAGDSLYIYGIVLLLVSLVLNTITYFPELPHFEELKTIVSRTPAAAICGYTSFYIFGYYIYSHRPERKKRIIIYALGVAAIILSAVTAIVMTAHGMNAWDGHFFTKQTITVFAKNTAIFLFFICALSRIKYSERAKKVLRKLSATTFFIYLFHLMVLKVVSKAGFYSLGMDPFLACFLLSIVVFAIGFVVAFIFQLVPWRKIKNALVSVVKRSD